jgi:class 3 adenylate cyclase
VRTRQRDERRLIAVLDAVGSESCAHCVRDADYPWGVPAQSMDRFMAHVKDMWGTDANVETLAPSRSGDDRFRERWARNQRLGVGPGQLADIIRAGFERDARPQLASIRIPTLVLHREANRYIHVGAGRYLAHAVRCAAEIVVAAKAAGLEVRAGLHTGEIELRGDDIAGLAVNIARRVCDIAGPTQVLVSETVKGLLVGSGIPLSEQGSHILKGVPDEWRLFAVAD